MIATEHVRELAAHKSKAYDLLLALEENPHANEACFPSLAQIVDWMVSHPVSIDDGILSGLRAYLQSTEPDLASTLRVLWLALSEAALPSRVNLLLLNYPHWLSMLSNTARPHFLGILPNIATRLDELEGDDLGGGGVETLILRLNACASAEDCEILSGCVERYQETSGKILAAAAEIADVAIRTNSRVLVEQLMTAVSPESIHASKAAGELLPAMSQIKRSAANDAVWSAGIGVCIALAAGDQPSSALHLARHLEKSLASLTADAQLSYLNSFQRMVEAAGISFVGYGTKEMSPLFQEAEGQRATEFVEQGMAIARRYGSSAAEEFLNRSTSASREASPLR